MTYSPFPPEVVGYYWHRDEKSPNNRSMRKERIVKVITWMGVGLIVFDPDAPLETISAEVYGGEFAGPIPKPEEAIKC